jgi:hypothetical protein
MARRLPVWNSEFMKAIRDVYSFFQDDSLKIKNNQPILPHTAIVERVCAALGFLFKILTFSPST